MKAREFQLWLLGQGYSQITIKHSLSYIRFLEGMGLDVDHVENVEDVLLFFAELRSKGTKTTTLNYYVKALNRYFAFRGVDIKLKYYRHRTKDTIWIPTDDEVKRILSVRWRRYDQDLRNRAMLHIAFSTGVRLGELIALNWADLDETNHLLEIRTEKSGGTRLVPIPPKVLELLIQYRKVRILSDPNAMFTTYGGRISNAYARKIFKEAGERAGVKKFHSHAARHWRAVKWLEEGLSLETIRRLLGHSSLKSTQIYLRARSVNSIFEEVVKKDSFWWKGQHGVRYLNNQEGGVYGDWEK